MKAEVDFICFEISANLGDKLSQYTQAADMHWKFKTGLIFTIALLLVQQGYTQFQKDPNDPHGGIPMGISSSVCDDAKIMVRVTNDVSKTGVANDVNKTDVANDVNKTGVANDVDKTGVANDVNKTDVANDVNKTGVANDVNITGVTNDVSKAGVTNDVNKTGVTIDVNITGVTNDVNKTGVTNDVNITGVANDVNITGVTNDTNIEIDWDPQSTAEFTCTDPWKNDQPEQVINLIEEEEVAKKPTHVCQYEPIHYDSDLPTSGAHRPLWPVYGEYKYIPPQRWLHSLEHGAILLLYHPCANKDEIKMARKIVKNCLRKHIISPYKKMPPGVKFVLMAWRKKLMLNFPYYNAMVSFIKANAKKAPEGPLATDGQYSIGLLDPAEIVSDIDDSRICPKNQQMEETANDISKKSAKRRGKYESLEKRLANAIQSVMAGH
ncbi:hypothetical protein Btru_002520 [Bulinus truncatus]|nr:hypothetical protein Btru_002520 [Bulinus truncatus]